MTRLRTDQACLAAQVQQQIAQRLNAEFAVPCPDCGAEAGRACQGDFGRSVVTHLARSVASMRRDTEPCPPPLDGAFRRSLRTEFDALWLETVPNPAPESLFGIDKTPTASACAPSPAASAPDADETVLARAVEKSGRPVCKCGQTIWGGVSEWYRQCGDCMRSALDGKRGLGTIDRRIAETREPDAVQCAWSTPSSEGESW